MKRNLLFAAVTFMSISATAQFTQTNSPVIGDKINLYELDNTAPSYDATTGSGVTWDYSAVAGTVTTPTLLQVLAPGSATNGNQFPNSQKAIELGSLLTTFLTTSSSDETAQGFYASLTGLGTVTAVFGTGADQETLYQYPMNLGSSVSDNFAGSFSATTSSNPPLSLSGTLTGSVTATFDGSGTLKLAHNSYANVSRFKINENYNLSISLFGNNISIPVTRTQYEYYDFTKSRLPIFVYTDINANLSALGQGQQDTKAVYSLESPAVLGVNDVNSKTQVSVYPNPATNILNIQLPAVSSAAQVTIFDATGRQVYFNKLESSKTTVNVSGFSKGVYFVKIEDGNQVTTKKVVVQ